MTLPIRMISPIGNKLNSRRALTFVEVCVTLVVLAGGIVCVYRAFFACLDYTHHLSCRLFAFHYSESKLSHIQWLSDAKSDDKGLDQDETRVRIDNKVTVFQWQGQKMGGDGQSGVARYKGTVRWNEGAKQSQLTRDILIKS